MNSSVKKFVGLGLVFAVMSLSACAGQSSISAPVPATNTTGAPAAAKKPLEGVKLKISYSPPTLGNLQGYKAMDIMRQWGAQIDEVEITSTGSALQAMVAGEIHMGEGSVAAGYQAAHAGSGLVMVAGHDTGNDWVLVTRKDIQKLEDLQGRLFALGSSTGEDPTLRRMAFGLVNLDADKEKSAILGGNKDRAQAVLAKQADAANLHMPWYLWLSKQTQDVHIILEYSEKFPEYLSDVFWAHKDWVAKNERVVVAWNIALLSSARWIYDHPTEAVALARQRIPDLTEDEAKEQLEAFAKVQLWKPDKALDLNLVQKNYDLSFPNLKVDGAKLEIGTVVVNKYEAEALAKLGAYEKGKTPLNLPADLDVSF